ncbi:MAG TPA: hypothetical protein VIH16_06250 [Bellilinea sp.]
MRNRTVEVGEILVTVSEATGLMGMRRQILRNEAFQPDAADAKKMVPVYEDEAMQVLRLISYPDCAASLVSSTGLPTPLTFEDFIELPDVLLERWATATYELNPHWLELPSDEKKA